MIVRTSLATIGALLVGVAQACEVPVLANAHSLADGNTSSMAWRFVPPQPKIGEFFAVEFGGCAMGIPFDAATLRIDAIMPAHRHGMNFRPKLVDIGPGLYRAEGMMFHMPGLWQLSFEQRTAAGVMRLTTDIVVE